MKMAWRPTDNLIEGVLDNTENGKITGYMSFHGMEKSVPFSLRGNFRRDIRGTIIKFHGDGKERNAELGRDGSYMEGFSNPQTGEAGDITAGLPIGSEGGEVIYDYVDSEIPMLTRMSEKRIRGYRSLGYEIITKMNS